MSHIGHPLVGDDKYGDRSANRKLSAAGICLWCRSLEIQDEKNFPEHAGRALLRRRAEVARACPERRR